MSKTYSKTRTLVECALMIALGTVLANIKIFEMPNGGSIIDKQTVFRLYERERERRTVREVRLQQ